MGARVVFERGEVEKYMRIRRIYRISYALVFAALVGNPCCFAQGPAPTAEVVGVQALEIGEPGGQILSFRHLSGTTTVEMRGTKIMPSAWARLKIESRPGFIELDINRGDIKGLEHARRFGRDFLTYVLWTVSVDGAAMNLGEITFDQSGPVGINVTTPYQTFWLMVTAEPDFAVNDPSPVVVLYSVGQDAIATANKALPVPGKLLYYTYYTRYDTNPAAVVTGIPNELLQARKAVELAAASGVLAAPTPAGQEPLPDEIRTLETFNQARQYLQQAEEAFQSGGNIREAVQFARTAAQIAENARALALGAVGRLYVRKMDRELEKARSEAAKCQAESVGLRDRLPQLEAAVTAERQQTQLMRARVDELEKELASLRQSLEAVQAREGGLRASLEQAHTQNALLRQDREKICGELRRQLASVGQLTQQGGDMVLTLASDILFDLGSYELRPAARENLAKLAVLRLLLFPNANVRYIGHTDRVGEDDYNQWLSEQRALAVYRYLLQEQLSHESDQAVRGNLELRLLTAEKLTSMSYAGARRAPLERQRLLAELGEAVVGMGEREPVEDVPGPSERNRRVVLLFPPAQVGQVSSLCDSPPPLR